MADADSNNPSWLTADASVPASPNPVNFSNNPAAEKPAKSGGMFKMFSKEAATDAATKVATKAAISHVSQNIANQPDDGFTPAWATGNAYTPPTPVGQDVENRGGGGGDKDGSGPVPLDIEPELLKRMEFYHRILRILYMISAILMGTAAGLSLVAQTDIGMAFFAIYVLFFSLLICCFEVGLNAISRFIATNFGFMYTLSGRAVFLVFVGVMSFSLSIFGKAAMALLFLVGLIHGFVMFRFPKFSEYVRQKDFFKKS